MWTEIFHNIEQWIETKLASWGINIETSGNISLDDLTPRSPETSIPLNKKDAL